MCSILCPASLAKQGTRNRSGFFCFDGLLGLAHTGKEAAHALQASEATHRVDSLPYQAWTASLVRPASLAQSAKTPLLSL